jgi:hypothetical protein
MKPVKLAAVVLAAAMAVGTAAAAQEHYPSRLITVVVPLTAGTTIDILARLFAESLSKRFGQQVIVANRPGAGGLIAAQAVATAPADGYTVLLANSGHAILGTLNKNLPFDPIGDFAAVSLIGDAPTLVTVAPSLGVRSLTEFVELAKAKPGAINYGSAGVGTATHLAGMYFAAQTGTDLVHVPYTVSSTHRRSARRTHSRHLRTGCLYAAIAARRPIAGARRRGQRAYSRADCGPDRARSPYRLSKRDLVRLLGPRQDARIGPADPPRRDRRRGRGARAQGKDSRAGHHAAKHRASRLRRAHP